MTTEEEEEFMMMMMTKKELVKTYAKLVGKKETSVQRFNKNELFELIAKEEASKLSDQKSSSSPTSSLAGSIKLSLPSTVSRPQSVETQVNNREKDRLIQDGNLKALAKMVAEEGRVSVDPVSGKTLNFLNNQGQGQTFLPQSAGQFLATRDDVNGQPGSGIAVDLNSIKQSPLKRRSIKNLLKTGFIDPVQELMGPRHVFEPSLFPKVKKTLENKRITELKQGASITTRKNVLKKKGITGKIPLGKIESLENKARKKISV